MSTAAARKKSDQTDPSAEPVRMAAAAPLDGRRALAFTPDPEARIQLAAVLRQAGLDAEVRDGTATEALRQVAEADEVDLVFVDLGDGRGPLSGMLSLAAAFAEEILFIALGSANDIALYRRLLAAGVSDYLLTPVTAEEVRGCLAAEERAAAASGIDPGRAERIAVIGARGGVGASALALSLAWSFAEECGRETALLDLDLEFGTLALGLDLEPGRGLREALEAPERIDDLFLSGATSTLTDRLVLLASEGALGRADATGADGLAPLLETIGRARDVIVMDTPRVCGALLRRAIEQAGRCILVTELTLPALRDTIRLATAIGDWNPAAPVTVVANRIRNRHEAISRRDFEKALGRRIDALVPDDPKSLGRAAAEGKPVTQAARRGKAGKAIRELADILLSQPPAARAGRSLIGRLGRRHGANR